MSTHAATAPAPTPSVSRTAAVRVALQPHALPIAIILTAFAVSRIAAAIAGVRFDTEPLGTFWQYIDVPLLKHHLVQSTWWFYYQPPLYNLFLGAVLKLFGGSYAAAFQVVYLLFGIANGLAMYALGVRLGLRRGVACLVATGFTISPVALLFENWLFYEYLVMAALVFAGVAFHAFLSKPTVARGSVFFGLVWAIVWTRSMFQWIWVVAVLALVLVALWPHRRVVLKAAAIPCLLVLALYVKNYAIEGVPSTSAGYDNASVVTTWRMPLAERLRYVKEGKLSAFALAPENLPPYRRALAALGKPKPTGIAVLDRPLKVNGRNNFNALSRLRFSKAAFKDVPRSLRLDPGNYLDGRLTASRLYFRPAIDYDYLKPYERDAIRGWTTIWDAVVYGRTSRQPAIGRFVLLFYVGVLLWGLVSLVRFLQRRLRREPTSIADATILFLWLNVLYVTALSILLEQQENQRDRLLSEPLVWLLVALGLARAVGRWRARRAARGAPVAVDPA